MDRGEPDLGGEGQVALAIAHPGHELRLLRWIEAVRPTVFVLTAGSRNGEDTARVTASRVLADRLGATPGAVFGRHLDREVYGWIMASDDRPLRALAEELAESFVRQDLRTVVTDSWQLYNAVHDLWHLTVRVAACMASAKLGRPILCLDYPVAPSQMVGVAAGRVRVEMALSPAEVEYKLKVAAEFPAIADDVADAVRAGGRAFLASETLHDVPALAGLAPAAGEQPLYERYGEARVAAGRYGSVLRWRHVEPITRALSRRLHNVEPAA